MSKGDKPRNCFSKQYRANYDDINWPKKMTEKQRNAQSDITIGCILQSTGRPLSSVAVDDQVKISQK